MSDGKTEEKVVETPKHTVEHVKTEEFDKIVLNKEKKHNKEYIFVDFYAQWCGPCKRFSPELDKMCEKYGDKIYFLKVDVDECEELADRYNITQMPTFMTFVPGNLKDPYSEPIHGAIKITVENHLQTLVNPKVDVKDDF